MDTRREDLMWRGGVLVGLGGGLALGFGTFLLTFSMSMHHMFLLGVQWSSPGLYGLALPTVLCLATGFHLRRKAGIAHG